MKKIAFTASLIGMIIMTGCQNTASENELFEDNGNTVNVNNENGIKNGKDTNSGFGYVRHVKNNLAQENDYDKVPQVDYEKTANAISSLIVQLPNIQDVATLVTDEEVLIAYQSDTKNRNETADQVKKTAISVVPRYYHVYLSDDPEMIKQVEGYSGLDPESRDIDQIINNTIKEMLKSPQGRKLNKGENANGEGYGETNENLDQDMKDKYEQTRYK
ncbi:YhcN/YlaJ family sporulation lipoprotein [Peribacillus frigoritolerans]|uniref:YhcN/YlaJ family sporulation lipoprotein n=1 Tax=Peribacillus frigoritolerans TaxID=450367 RepID=UPI00105A3AD5|nr:YhcN/YlaJ family sporulation lipoprotein [Peribacillus frigoritolerans]TDL78681.1 sporulation protein [Peribacillus frigoritolerans]